ncbi:motility associated factor glycosyltransferase family protein [Heliobacterium mobile]|nr:6-hydroxymethylpterin diphosphokinase MptE-like protein [Heliobacterium mobile]
MSRMDRNIRFFQEYCPLIIEQLQGWQPHDLVQVVPSRVPGIPTAFYQREAGSFYLHSRYNPIQEAEAWASQQDLDGIRHVIIFGLAFGYHVEALVKRKPNVQLHIYEPDGTVFLASLHDRDWTAFPWQQVRHLAFDGNRPKQEQFLMEMIQQIKDDWTILTIPSVQRCFPEVYSSFQERMKSLRAGYVESLEINIPFQKEWAANALKNLPHILRTDSVFKHRDFFAGQMAIMTASGPSLTEAIPYLRTLKKEKKAIIVAAGTSINALVRHGVSPHMFVSYDPFVNNYKVLQANLDKGIPMVFGSTIYSDIVSEHVGPQAHFILNQDNVYEAIVGGLNTDEVISDAPSIAVVTLQLLYKLGIRKLILAGQDLAFIDDHRYAVGVNEAGYKDGRASEEDRGKYNPVEANDGSTVFTDNSFQVMRQNLEYVIQQIPSGEMEIINTARRGAKIAGTIYSDWESLLALSSDKTPTGKTPLLFPRRSGTSLKPMAKRVEKILDDIYIELKKTVEQLHRFSERCNNGDQDKALKSYQKVLQSLGLLLNHRGFTSLVAYLVRNETHIIQKYLPDAADFDWEEKKRFAFREIPLFLRGVEAALQQLRQGLTEWS